MWQLENIILINLQSRGTTRCLNGYLHPPLQCLLMLLYITMHHQSYKMLSRLWNSVHVNKLAQRIVTYKINVWALTLSCCLSWELWFRDLPDTRRLISNTSCTISLNFPSSTCFTFLEAWSLETNSTLLNAGPHKSLALIPPPKPATQSRRLDESHYYTTSPFERSGSSSKLFASISTCQ